MSTVAARPPMPKTLPPKSRNTVKPAPSPGITPTVAQTPTGSKSVAAQNTPATQKASSAAKVTATPKLTAAQKPGAPKVPAAQKQSVVPLVIEHTPQQPMAPPAWLNYLAPVWSGIKTALQSATAVYALLALVVLVALQADGNSASWGAALGGAARFWLLAHGAGATFGALQLDILPLGLTALCLWVLRMFTRRTTPLAVYKPDNAQTVGTTTLAIPTSSATTAKARTNGAGTISAAIAQLTAGALTYSFFAASAARVIGASATTTARATMGALAIGALGMAWRLLPTFPPAQTCWNWCPLAAKKGLKAAAISHLATFGAAAALTGVWAALGISSARAAAQTLQAGLVGSVVVGAAQLTVLPNWLAWAAGWLVGPGFSLGTGSQFTPGNWYGGPLPALPIMAALPPETWAGPLFWFAPVVVLLVGALAGKYLSIVIPEKATWQTWLAASGTCVAAATAGMLIAQWLARGSLGSGRLAMVGANPWLVSVVFGAELAAGIAMVILGKKFGNRKTNNE